MADNNIRREIIYKFRLAIDCEDIGNKEDAYINYLEGLSLVASALKVDSNKNAGSMSIGEKKTLLGFAKRSVERLLLILDKSEKVEVEKNLDEILEINKEASNITTNFSDLSEVQSNPLKYMNSNLKAPIVFEENLEQNVCSPLMELQKENNILIARYNKRMQLAPSDFERQNLQLELERRLVENSAIATRHQAIWARKRSQMTLQFKQLAQQKFVVQDETKDNTVQDMDLRKQETFAASLQYAMDSTHLRNLQQEFSNDTRSTSLSRSLVTCILSDSKHPVGNLLHLMQVEVVRNLSHHLNDSNKVDKMDHQTFFKTVSTDIKSNINMLDTLVKALYEPLSLDIHLNIVTELIYYFYFGTLKSDLIQLLRLCTKETEEMLENKMNSENNQDSVLDENTKLTAVLNLKRMMAHHSPCGMLDWLVAIIKSLAYNNDLACNSLGADDLLPRLIKVVLSSQEHTLPAYTLFMESFLPSFKALGEEGYSLTLLQSVIVCITTNQT